MDLNTFIIAVFSLCACHNLFRCMQAMVDFDREKILFELVQVFWCITVVMCRYTDAPPWVEWFAIGAMSLIAVVFYFGPRQEIYINDSLTIGEIREEIGQRPDTNRLKVTIFPPPFKSKTLGRFFNKLRDRKYPARRITD